MARNVKYVNILVTIQIVYRLIEKVTTVPAQATITSKIFKEAHDAK